MAVENKVIVVLHNPGGNLIKREVKFHPVTGLASNLGVIGSALQVVALFVVRDCGDIPEEGGPFWTSFEGHSMFKCEQDGDGVAVAEFYETPSNYCRTRRFGGNVSDVSTWRIIDSKLAQSWMGSGVNWDVVDGGEGSVYEGLVQDAKVLVGYPVA